MLYTAILVACLAGGPLPVDGEPMPASCRSHEMRITAGANPASAFLEAQVLAAKWLADRPGLEQFSLTIHVGRGV